jgi:hypothetical protein
VERDELNGWFASFDRYTAGTRGGDVANWLSIFNCKPITVDRKSAEGPLFIPRPIVCVLGGIQPGVLRRALGQENRENGLAARLLMAWPPQRKKRWTEAEIDPAIEWEFARLGNELLEMDARMQEDGRCNPIVITLSEGAKRLWIEFTNAHGEEQLELTGDLGAAWSKLEAYAARIALILHCVVDRDTSEVSESTMASALQLIAWFKHETRRIYLLLAEDDKARRLRRLREWIAAKGGRVTVRMVQQGRRGYKTADEAEADLRELEKAGDGYCVLDTHQGGPGRPVGYFVLKEPSVYGIPEIPEELEDCVDVDTDSADDDEWGAVA